MTDDPARPASLIVPREVTDLRRYLDCGSQRLHSTLHIEGGSSSIEDLFAAVKACATALHGVILLEGFSPEAARPAMSARCLPVDFKFRMDDELISLSGIDRRMAPPVPFVGEINTTDLWHFRLYNATDGFFELRLTGPSTTIVLYIMPYQNELRPYLPSSRG